LESALKVRRTIRQYFSGTAFISEIRKGRFDCRDSRKRKMPPSELTGYRFGSFEVQLRNRVLLHKNYRVRIQRLPFQLLILLLERPGELVSRDVLCAALWSSETFVEFDNSLYVAAAKLREALGDDPTNPRYVKTVSRQGYQFVADVVAVVAAEPASTVELEQLAETPGLKSTGEPAVELSLPATSTTDAQPGKRRPILGIAAALCAFFLYRFLNRPLASYTDKILLGEVRNATGDPSLDGAFSSALRFKLEESPSLSLVDNPQFRRQAWRNSTSHLSPSTSLQDGLAACTRIGAQLFLSGEIVNHSPGYRVEIRAWRCRNGRLLTTQLADAVSQSEMLPALETAALAMRRRLGESDKFNAPPVQATTSSLAALKAFTNGEMDRLGGDPSDAATNYKLAVDLDPRFALA
jgi:DNA-binding winged helix-turn-helix (wHTH) protein